MVCGLWFHIAMAMIVFLVICIGLIPILSLSMVKRYQSQSQVQLGSEVIPYLRAVIEEMKEEQNSTFSE